MSMNIIIRTDASNMIGTGHVMRCLTLAEQLIKANAQTKITLISRDLPGNLSELIKSKGFDIKLLEFSEEDKKQYAAMPPNDDYAKWLGVKSEQDAQEVLEVINSLNLNAKIDLLIIDHYALDIKWERLLRPKVKKIMVIDDLANREHDCDVILDHNFYLDLETRYDKLVPESCKKLLGPKHALINPKLKYVKENRARAGKGNSLDQIENILVFLGGADPKNFTDKALGKALSSKQLKDCLFNVVLGKSNPHKLELKQKYAQYDNVIFHVQPSYYYELLEKADLAIGAGGVSQLERCYIELPSVVMVVADNQVGIFKDMLYNNLIFDMESYCGKYYLQIEKLVCKYLDLFNIKNCLPKNYFDLYMRNADSGDAKLLFEWRNNKGIRKFFFNKNKISFTEHKEWFEDALIDPKKIIYIFFDQGLPVGIVRFDLHKDTALIDIYINPKKFGLGYGKRIMKQAIKHFKSKSNNFIDTLIARVLENNQASHNLFNSIGFENKFAEYKLEI